MFFYGLTCVSFEGYALLKVICLFNLFEVEISMMAMQVLESVRPIELLKKMCHEKCFLYLELSSSTLWFYHTFESISPPMSDAGTMEKVFLGIIVGLMCVTALVANFLVIFVVYRNTALRQQFSSVFIVNLAMGDFLTALFSMPLSLGALVYRGWPFSSLLCHFNGFSNQILGISAILTLAVISIDRFYAVIKPLKYRAKMTMQKAFNSVCYVWVQSALFSLVPALHGWYIFNDNYFFCTFSSVYRNTREIAFTYCLYLFNFGAPLIIMLGAYYKIFQVARRHSQRIAPAVVTLGTFGIQNLDDIRKEIGRQREARAARKIILVIAAFLCCNAPYTIMRLLELIEGCELDLPMFVTVCAKLLNFLKSSLDPLIYGLFQRRFRCALSALFLSKSRERRIPRPSLNQTSCQSRRSDIIKTGNENNSLTPTESRNSTDRNFWIY